MSNTSQKIGLGLITCNRPDFFKKAFASIPLERIQQLVVINDGTPFSDQMTKEISNKCFYIQNDTNLGVGKSKNKAMQYLLDTNCTDIFLMEDDIIIKNSEVFEKYIKVASETKLPHFMFGYHGPANKANGVPTPRLKVDYPSSVSVAFNRHCVGAFCYYTANLLKEIGLNDDFFTNAWEHVEHSYRIVKAGYIPAYWWWPDIADSYEYLDELACSEHNSTIRPRADWMENIQRGAHYFYNKHGFSPVSIPDSSAEQVRNKLRDIFKK
jgi:GT2 family glycosyltransferase